MNMRFWITWLVAAGTVYGDMHRTGYVTESLSPPYRLAWEHVAPHAPRPAWPEPVWEPQRIDYDYAYAVAARGDMVFYASSSDHALHALDRATGRERWAFTTGGPVRLAPDFHGDRVLFGSDDGFLYCVNQADGALVWKYRPEGIPESQMIGNEQMISRWPCRTGALVEGDRVYAGFGVLSPEGVAVCCLDARTGRPIWVNDTCGYRYMNRPHSIAIGGVAPDGYLTVTDKQLVVATGRSTPALFDKQTGQLLYHEAEGDFTGGAVNMTADGLIFTQADTLQKEFGNSLRRENDAPEMDVFELATLVALDPATGHEVFSVRGGSRGVIAPDGQLTLIGRGQLISTRLDRVRGAAPAKPFMIAHTLGHFVESDKIKTWAAPVDRVYALLQAGPTLLAGGRDWVGSFDAATGKKLWEQKVEGQVRAMCLAPGAWIVSTTAGRLYCFAPGNTAAPTVVTGQRVVLPAPSAGGYCLALGRQDAASLRELAARYDLVVHPRRGDEVAALRQQMGLPGSRVSIQPNPGPALPYTDYFADAIDCQVTTEDEVSWADLYRVLRPYGGVAEIRCPAALRDAVQKALSAAAGEVTPMTTGLRVTRGALAGAGEWTHQYGDAGRRVSSDERRVRLPVKAAWFGGLGPGTILTRHYRAPAPLVIDGRCFVFGTDVLTAFNIYNGRILWQREFKDLARWPTAYRAAGTAVDHDRVYFVTGRECRALDPATGETRATFPLPAELLAGLGSKAVWEYLAVSGDWIVGTLGETNVKVEWYAKAYPVNRVLFALDRRTGQLRWSYRAEEGIDSNAIAIDDGTVCLIDGRPRYPYLPGPAQAPRTLRALDLATGKQRWESRTVAPTQNCLWMDDGVVVATQIPVSRGIQDPQAEKLGGGLTAFAVVDGKQLWRVEKIKNLVPMIIDGVFYAPAAYDLHTGKPIPAKGATEGQFQPRLSLTCSTQAGCPTLIVARQGSLGFYDLANQGGAYTYPIVRPSCWINMIPAGGLVVVPEGGSSCQCAFNYKTSMAFLPDDRQFHYGTGGARGETPGVRVNFGAPGQRTDAAGQTWQPFPAPVALGRSLGEQPYDARPLNTSLNITVEGDESALATFGRNPDWLKIAGTDQPWLFACGLRGPVKMSINLPRPLQTAGQCRVTLYFCELDDPAPPRVFDVKLQGQTVLPAFNIVATAGGPHRAVMKTFTIKPGATVELELSAASPTGPPPVISGLLIEP